MTDRREDALPEDHAGTDPAIPPQERDEDARSDLEQILSSRSDAVERGDGGPEPETMTDTGLHDGLRGAGGEIRSQDLDAR